MPIRPENLDRYPADWAKISYSIRFARAMGHCECLGECRTGHTGRCEARHNGEHPVTGSKVVLTVAHLDHTPENCDPANLRAMCQRCHISYDADEHKTTAARTKAAETATWNTPLPTLEAPPAPPAPSIPHRSHFPAGKGDVDLDRFNLIRVPETPEEHRELAGAYIASRAQALGWTRPDHEQVLLALFQPPRAVSDAERHNNPNLFGKDRDA